MGKTYPRVTELLKREFEEKKVSKYAFCKQTGINPTSVERYLCGISEPNQSSLEKLAEYFDVSVAWLRGDVDRDFEQEVVFWKELDRQAEEIDKAADDLDELHREIKILEKMGEYKLLVTEFIAVPDEKKEEVLTILAIIKKHKDRKREEKESSTAVTPPPAEEE